MSVTGEHEEPVGGSLGGPLCVSHRFPDHLSLPPERVYSTWISFLKIPFLPGPTLLPTLPPSQLDQDFKLAYWHDCPLLADALSISLFHILHCYVGRLSSSLPAARLPDATSYLSHSFIPTPKTLHCP